MNQAVRAAKPASQQFKHVSPPQELEVKWFNATKGYGFFYGPHGRDVFVHKTLVRQYNIDPDDMQRDAKFWVTYGEKQNGKLTTCSISKQKPN